MTQDNPTAAPRPQSPTSSFTEFTRRVEYSFMDALKADPEATPDGEDHQPRQVFSGHYVPVTPTPIADPVYVSHSQHLFDEIGLSEDLLTDKRFCQLFCGDLSSNAKPLRSYGWATGYALSIYGTEYTRQCPFGTGNGYGDGRAISVVEVLSDSGKRWEMQLKGGGPTPYCRGADGRAVLRSSVREFLAQEFMHALGVPTSRSLTLFASRSETVARPWYSPGSRSFDPDVMVDNPVAISTRVASSFLRVGQIELFARRARSAAHPEAMEELRLIVAHAIQREYAHEINESLPFPDQVVAMARLFRQRLIQLVGHWLRVGYCQGNFNSDNCAVGGFTLDYGPFGFMERFDPMFQPWTGGGEHFSFFNQPAAAEANFHVFWKALSHLVPEESAARRELVQIREDFALKMDQHVQGVWASKLGLKKLDPEFLSSFFKLMYTSQADFTQVFRQLAHLPSEAAELSKSFAQAPSSDVFEKWQAWLSNWNELLRDQHGDNLAQVSARMLRTNPKYTWREWLVASAYQEAADGDYESLRELQDVLSAPYGEQAGVEKKYEQAAPEDMRGLGGIAHYSCSS